MKTKSIKCKLPKHLYSLMRVALDDLKLIEKDPNYSVYMEEDWHVPPPKDTNDGGKCEVCFAGAVMAQTCKTPISAYVSPEDFPNTTREKLHSINLLRGGYVYDAYAILHREDGMHKAEDWIKASNLDRSMPAYTNRATNKENNKRWWQAARKLQKALKKANI